MKALSHRLNQVIASVISVEQYTIIFWLPNFYIIIAKFRIHHLPSLQLTNAFDRISHAYLFKVLKLFGFGDRFVETMKKVYERPTAIIKHHGSLLSPIELKTGIRQGCPISGSLYVICFEVLLHNFRSKLTTSALDLTITEHRLVSLAYADDLLLFATKDNSFPIMKQILDQYEQHSNAKINYEKTIG